MQIENKIALVTGGANGIGFVYTKELLRNGAAHVAILDLPNSNGEEAVGILNKEFGKGKVIFLICDVTNLQQLEDGFAKTVAQFGGLDIVINNAGIMNDSQWELMVNINYNGVVRGTMLGLKYMGKDKGGKGGTIVNISSLVGIIPAISFPIYNGTKHAVVGFSRSIAQPYHYERTGVRILVMCPGITNTQLITKADGRSLDIVTSEDMKNEIGALPMQSVGNVAQGMIHIIRSAENGTVWLSEADEPIYELEVPEIPVRKLSAKY